jgi:sterol desaturase/sphingolipid hydroxylase (fatty acid hydroxylase superfamily)
MEINPIVLSIPIYFILIGIEVAYDRFKGLGMYRLNDALGNISCGITEQVTGVFAKVFTVALYHYFYTHFRLLDVPQTWYWAVILFIGVDFFYYWAHRYSHEINLFWTGHSIHHQSEDYNFSVALRQGALRKIFTAPFYIPLALLGFQTDWFLYIGAFTTLYQFWIHTEAIDKLPKWFEFIFNTPSHHRVHHGRNPEYIDKNHGGTFIIFDRMFGTFTPETERPTYGVTTPINTFDPITAHARPLLSIWSDWQRVDGLWNKFLILIKPPGWLPADVGGFRNPPEVHRETFAKFNTEIPLSLGTYVLTQYLPVLGIAAYFLFNHVNLTGSQGLLAATLILLHVMIIGKVLDLSKSGRILEVSRLLISAVFVIVQLGVSVFSGVATGFVILSILWFLSISRNLQPTVSG